MNRREFFINLGRVAAIVAVSKIVPYYDDFDPFFSCVRTFDHVLGEEEVAKIYEESKDWIDDTYEPGFYDLDRVPYTLQVDDDLVMYFDLDEQGNSRVGLKRGNDIALGPAIELAEDWQYITYQLVLGDKEYIVSGRFCSREPGTVYLDDTCVVEV